MVDNTEGFGAYDDLGLKRGTINFDNGGCKLDDNTHYLRTKYGVTNHVYDKYKRSTEHNTHTLSLVDVHAFDTATSNSLLNVITSLKERHEHIELSFRALKPGGTAYFKVWRGDGSCRAALPQPRVSHYYPEQLLGREPLGRGAAYFWKCHVCQSHQLDYCLQGGRGLHRRGSYPRSHRRS